MTQTNILQLAKQGDTEAIASLINRQLQPRGITATVAFKDACLQVMLESTQMLNQQALVAFVQKGITGLGAASIEVVEVSARQTGEEFPAWKQKFYLGIVNTESKYVDDEQPSTNPHGLTIAINLSGDTARELTTKDFEIIADKMSTDIFSSCNYACIKKVCISNGSSVITKER
ncbi:hypothetical protein WKK05_27545 [Nostoc sp. UHCC 0302]|uniref:hypothetical protein n=1 Tax=Nostoc sp. UHCC 0302 TaxID=3134896 RepID=UPI00311CDCF7